MQDSINGIYIPKDIDDCMTELDKMLDDSLKCEIRKMSADEFQAKAHFGLGMWMRNNYGLWQGSRLAVYIRKNCDVRHPDDMSGVILSSYYNHLTVGNEKD